MTRITTEQRAAVMPSIAPVVPVMSGLVYGRTSGAVRSLEGRWPGQQTDPCSGNHRTTGFTAKRPSRHLRRSST